MTSFDKTNVIVSGSRSAMGEYANYTTVIPKPILFDGHMVLTQSMISKPNTKYVIKWNFELAENITIPANCVLEFDGGSISGEHTITGNNTFVDVNQDTTVFHSVILAGSFKAKELAINIYDANNKLDYLYSFLQAFSGTQFYLNDNYSATEYLGLIDGITPRNLNIDGRGYSLTLYSFGAYNMQQCEIKNITINASNNINASWKYDSFNFGLLGYSTSSILILYNVIFTSQTQKAYIRGFNSIDISNCIEDGSYFFIYDVNNVEFHDNTIKNATDGYMAIGTQDENGRINIYNNIFKNLSNSGVVLSGGVKYNVSIINNILENVGSGGAMQSCINIHPKGVVNILNNTITTNVGAASLDIDAASADMYDGSTFVRVQNNIIRNLDDNNSPILHSLALVGLNKLYFKGNTLTNQKFFYWDTPYIECSDNTFKYTIDLPNTQLASCTVHNLTKDYDYEHYFKRNHFFGTKPQQSYLHFSYTTSALSKPAKIYGISNLFDLNIDFVMGSSDKVFGDIYLYDGNLDTLSLFGSTEYSNKYNKELYPIGFKGYYASTNKELRGSSLGLCDIQGNPVGTLYIGTTAYRPTLCLPGTAYYDLTLGKTIYATGTKAQLAIQVTSEMTPQGNYAEDDVLCYMKNMVIHRLEKATSPLTIDEILEYLPVDYKYYIDRGILYVQFNFQTHTLTIHNIYVGSVGDDYGVIHSNTVDGFTTSHSLVSDGSISWVDATGTPV